MQPPALFNFIDGQPQRGGTLGVEKRQRKILGDTGCHNTKQKANTNGAAHGSRAGISNTTHSDHWRCPLPIPSEPLPVGPTLVMARSLPAGGIYTLRSSGHERRLVMLHTLGNVRYLRLTSPHAA